MNYLLSLLAVTICMATTVTFADDEVLHSIDMYYGGKIEELKPKAEAGDPVAQTAIGLHYQLGILVPEDYNKAVEWYKKAADQGEPNALVLLGLDMERQYAESDGDDRWLVQALDYYEKAAEKDHPYGLYFLGRFYRDGRVVELDEAKAFQYFKKAEARGLSAPRFAMAVAYGKGKGVFQNSKKAYALIFDRFDTGGFDPSLIYGAIDWEKWLGLEVSRAHDWLVERAYLHDPMAQYLLGEYYEWWHYDSGSKALFWYGLAAMNGNNSARMRLKFHANDMEDSPENASLALLILAQCGDPEAQYDYAQYLLRDDHLPTRSKIEGRKWLKKAAQQGHEKAKAELAK